MENKIILATGHAHAFHRASALAAINNGYFREEGLPEIELGATGEDSLTVKSLKAGEIHFGLDVRPGFAIEENGKGEEMYINRQWRSERDRQRLPFWPGSKKRRENPLYLSEI